jgi:hypothetical protein
MEIMQQYFNAKTLTQKPHRAQHREMLGQGRGIVSDGVLGGF